jgi:hypothetical protein
MPSEMIGWERGVCTYTNDDCTCRDCQTTTTAPVGRLPLPPPPPPLPVYDVAQLQAGEAVELEGVDANKFDFLAKGVIPCFFFFGTLSLSKFIAVQATTASCSLRRGGGGDSGCRTDYPWNT